VRRENLLIVALESCGLVAAACLALLGAVILAILVWALLVKWVATGDLGALFFKLGLGVLRLRHSVFIAVKGLRRRRSLGVLVVVARALKA